MNCSTRCILQHTRSSSSPSKLGVFSCLSAKYFLCTTMHQVFHEVYQSFCKFFVQKISPGIGVMRSKLVLISVPLGCPVNCTLISDFSGDTKYYLALEQVWNRNFNKFQTDLPCCAVARVIEQCCFSSTPDRLF